MPLDTPSQLWEGVTMNIVTHLPESIASDYIHIVINMDQPTKKAHYLVCRKDIDLSELAQLFFEHDICKWWHPNNTVSDRGTQFINRFRTQVHSCLGTDHGLSTDIHQQTDRQTDRQMQMMQQYLHAFGNYEQDSWVELFPLAQFTYYHTVHSSKRMTPFCVNSHYYPVMQFKAPKQPSSMKSAINPNTFAAGLVWEIQSESVIWLRFRFIAFH